MRRQSRAAQTFAVSRSPAVRLSLVEIDSCSERDPRKHLVRYFGWYANKSRGIRAKADGVGAHDAQSPAPRTPSAGAARRRWAALIKRVWQVDPLQCPRCGSPMKIISFIEPTQPDVIQKILAHCGLADEPARAPPPTVPRTPVRR